MKHLKQRVEKELQRLENELRFELPKEIQRAAAHGDLRENAEYKAALERQSYVQARVSQLHARLAQLATIRMASIPRDRVAFGSVVTVTESASGVVTKFEIVFADDGDASLGQISLSSPIGKALVGKEVGDEVLVKAPSGDRTFEIVELSTLHDREAEDEANDG
jgi:transcription elongation factor GreA